LNRKIGKATGDGKMREVRDAGNAGKKMKHQIPRCRDFADSAANIRICKPNEKLIEVFIEIDHQMNSAKIAPPATSAGDNNISQAAMRTPR